MRIALVAQEYPPETAKGGIGSQTYLKAHGLAALGHEMHVISRTPDAQRHHNLDGPVKVTRIPAFSTRLHLYEPMVDWVTYSAEVAATIEMLHWQTPFDLVEFPEWACEGYVHLLNQCEWNRVPSIVQLHGPLVMFANTVGWPDKNSEHYHAGIAMERTCLRLADAIFSSSQCSADWCAREYGLERDLIPVIHAGIDTELFSPQPLAKAANPTIVFAGKLARNKGVVLLTAAACALAREFPRLRLQLLGRGEPNLVQELRHMTETAELPGLLDLPGFVRREELPSHFSQAHIFAGPSQFEPGPGLVYLEAMGCGLPVIASQGSGGAEVVRDGHNGLLVPPDNVEALTAALRTLLKDARRREEMGRSARQYVLAEADSRVCIKRIEAFYRSVVKRMRA